MKWQDRQGKTIDGKEFMRRWKEGIKQTTPYQKAKINNLGYVIIFIGLISGIIVSLIKGYYWVVVVLIGAIIINSTQFLTNYQQYTIFKKIEVMEVEDEKQNSQLNNNNL